MTAARFVTTDHAGQLGASLGRWHCQLWLDDVPTAVTTTGDSDRQARERMLARIARSPGLFHLVARSNPA